MDFETKMVTRARFERAFPSPVDGLPPLARLILAASYSSAAPFQLLLRSWQPHRLLCDVRKKMVTRARFERATSSFGGWRSIQLSYRATIVDGRCSDHDITIEMNPGGA